MVEMEIKELVVVEVVENMVFVEMISMVFNEI